MTLKITNYLIGGIIVLMLSEVVYQLFGFMGMVLFIAWICAVCVILAFLKGASFRDIDEWVKCDYDHWHVKGQPCKLCEARVQGRFIRKV